MAGATWNCCHLGTFCVHHTTMHHVTSCKATYIRRIHLHFWQNDWGLLHATNRYFSNRHNTGVVACPTGTPQMFLFLQTHQRRFSSIGTSQMLLVSQATDTRQMLLVPCGFYRHHTDDVAGSTGTPQMMLLVPQVPHRWCCKFHRHHTDDVASYTGTTQMMLLVPQAPHRWCC